MSVWNDFGFRESPYATEPIPPTEEGDKLLVGREDEIVRLTTYLTSSGLHPTIEGENGVGKTSLVSVAGFRLRRRVENGVRGAAFIPLRRTFQLTATASVEMLASKVFYEVANAFIEHHDLLESAGLRPPVVGDIDRWLNAPLFASTGGGISVLGSGATAERSTEPNTSSGFSEAGFTAAIDRWLRQTFPSREAGGFIAVIDNLELLETSQAARTMLESMRDTVLDQPGLRWVLCGARGIVRTGASSPRLEGRLAEPLDVRPIADDEVAEVIARRIEAFRTGPTATAPVGPVGFRHLYDVLHRNLRNALRFAENFSFWLHEQENLRQKGGDYDALLEVWLTEQADRYASDTSLTNRAWEVFDSLALGGGNCSPSDYETFGFNSAEAMRPYIKALEDANLAASSRDDTDKRRKTIVLTPRGWLVRYARNGYRAPKA